jgi:xylan 1,4-beta-xylosidase
MTTLSLKPLWGRLLACGGLLVRPISRTVLPLLLATASLAQTVHLTVDPNRLLRPWFPVAGYFGYDEPNYTYASNGAKLIGELAAAFRDPVYIRTHFLLCTGDGTPGLKWGSTNAYTEDASGRPIYNWAVIDRIFDTYLHANAKPFVEIGFMPQALSTKPDPYRPTWIPGAANRDYSIGWSYPPKDYAKWSELIRQWVLHSVEKYGRTEVESWYWEVWNEPDISYWHGTPEEYDRLYDATAAAVKAALPTAKIGGPATTGPASAKAAEFLRQFLEHCDRGNIPLDFITYHAKGRTRVADGRLSLDLAKHTADVETGYKIVASFPRYRNLPIVLSESDPEGCAACSARVYPQNAYRNGPLYASFTAAALKNILDLAATHGVNIQGMLTWAFEFENQPYFEGFRTLATNGIDKPILNLFRMLGQMQGDRIPVTTSAPGVDAVAVRSSNGISILVWNYADADLPAPDAEVQLTVPAAHYLLRHYRIDATHSNAFTAWKQMGSPQHPTPAQQAAVESAGQLQLLESPRWINAGDLRFTLPRQSVSLIQLDTEPRP